MRGKILSLMGGVLATLAVLSLMGPTGGFPSRPRFQAVGINAVAPANLGDLTLTDSGNNATLISVNATSTGTLGAARINLANSTNRTFFAQTSTGFSGAFVTNGPTGESLNIGTNGGPVAFAVADTARLILPTAENTAEIRGTTTGIGNISFLRLTDSAGGSAGFFGDIAGGNSDIVIGNSTSGANIALSTTGTGDVLTNGVSIAASSGTFTASFTDACTTTPTITYDYQRIGNIVVLYPVAQTGFTCTGDSTGFATSGAPVPAAIRPNTAVDSNVLDGFTNNSAQTWAQLQIGTTGELAFHNCTSLTANCGVTSWTAAGNRGISLFQPITYMLGNP